MNRCAAGAATECAKSTFSLACSVACKLCRICAAHPELLAYRQLWRHNASPNEMRPQSQNYTHPELGYPWTTQLNSSGLRVTYRPRAWPRIRPLGSASLGGRVGDNVVRCTDGTAYATLLSIHNTTVHSTSLATMAAKELTHPQVGPSDALYAQLMLILVLTRSLRRVEVCRRDMVLLGALPSPATVGAEWMARLHREGIIMRPTTPIVLGNPATDKLHVWRLTEYRRVVFLDADILVLARIEDIFVNSDRALAVAHHESELMQAQCDIALEQRIVTALFAVQPSYTTFKSLIEVDIPQSRSNAFLLSHSSEQTMLACRFKGRTQVLPCGYLFSVNSPASTACRPGGRLPEVCARIFNGACKKWSAKALRRAGCRPGQCRTSCRSIVRHNIEQCQWSNASDIRAVHFKGTHKPYAADVLSSCARVRFGALKVQAGPPAATMLIPVDPLHDAIAWHEGLAKCVSLGTGLPVFFADGKLVDSHVCCTFRGILSAYWYEMANAP